jgi:hypothetical protein
MYKRRDGRWFVVCLPLAIALLASPGCQRGTVEAEIETLTSQCRSEAEEFVAVQRELWRCQAIIESLKMEKKLIEAAANPVVQNESVPDAASSNNRLRDARPTAVRALRDSLTTRNAALVPYVEVLSGKQSLEARASTAVRESLHEVASAPTRLREEQQKHGVRINDLDALSQPLWRGVLPYVFSRDFLLAWLVCLGSALALWGIIRHDFRISIRSRQHALSNEFFLKVRTRLGLSDGKSPRPAPALRHVLWVLPRWLWIHRIVVGAVAAIAVLVVSCWSLRPNVTELAWKERDGLAEQLKDLTARKVAAADQAQSLRSEIEKIRAGNDQAFAEQLTPDMKALVATAAATAEEEKSNAIQAAADAVATEVRALGHLREFSSYLGMAEQACTDLAEHVETLETDNRTVAQLAKVSSDHAVRLLYAKQGLFVLFLGLNVALVGAWAVRRRKARVAMSNVCPRCLAEGKLTTTNVGGKSAVACDSCKYEIDEAHRNILGLCFPTAGYAASGKTVWLAMFRRQVKYAKANSAQATFALAHTPGKADSLIDGILNALIRQRHNPEPTAVKGTTKDGIPEPLLYHLSDGDKCFPSSCLVNLFDLAGAMTAPELKGSELQQRALLMDGFLYFIDPTRPETVDEQRAQLAEFCEEIRKARNVPFGCPLPFPFAVCITKLDVLADPNRPGIGVYQRFIEELSPADRDREPTLRNLRQRHELLAKHREEFFPGWDIAEQVRTLVGGRYLFFPVSSAGFFGGERERT